MNDKKAEPRKWKFQKKNPNAMDVDPLSTKRRAEMMKKGLCFRCEKPGHIGKNCPDGQGRKLPSDGPKKMNAKELCAYIRSITAQLDEGERKKFYDELKKEGF